MNDAVQSKDLQAVLEMRHTAWEAHAAALLKDRHGDKAMVQLVSAYTVTDGLSRRVQH